MTTDEKKNLWRHRLERFAAGDSGLDVLEKVRADVQLALEHVTSVETDLADTTDRHRQVYVENQKLRDRLIRAEVE